MIINRYKAPPTAQGQWVSAYDNRKDFIYERTLAEDQGIVP